MKISGSNTLAASPEQVWAAIMDPAVLARCIPGCESLTPTGPHSHSMRVTAGVAAIKGTYDGQVALTDLKERLGDIVIGYNRDRQQSLFRDWKIDRFAPWQVVALIDGPTAIVGKGLLPTTVDHGRVVASLTFSRSGFTNFSSEFPGVRVKGLAAAKTIMLHARPAPHDAVEVAASE